MNKIYVSWEEFGLMIDELARDIKSNDLEYNGIYAPPRGGLPIAVALSHKLDLPLLMYPTEETLVVDDISDTGNTLHYCKCKHIATLFNTAWTITSPHFYVRMKKSKDDWIVFPWEI